MARYYNAPKNDIVDLTPRVPIEFYSKIMEQAQQNLNQANATGAAFMTDLYGQKYIDEASRDKAISQAQQPIAQALDRDFVTPATIASAVTQAGQLAAPWKNLNQKQVELAKNYEEDKRRLGVNFLGTDPTKISLMQNDRLISPEELKYASMNAKDIYDTFGQTYGANLLGVTDKKVASDIPFKYKLEKTKGLTKEEKLALLSPGTKDAVELASKMMATNPNLRQGLMDIYGNEASAMQALQELNLRASMDDKYAQVKDVSYLDDDWSLYLAKKANEELPPNPEVPTYPYDGEITPTATPQTIGETMRTLTGGSQVIDWSNIPKNQQGNIMALEPAKATGAKIEYIKQPDGSYKQVSTPTGFKERKPVANYAEAAKQISKYKMDLRKQGFPADITDAEAISIMETSINNSAQFYKLKDEVIQDQFGGNAFNPFVDSQGNFRPQASAELEVYNPKTNTWEGKSYEQLRDFTGWSKEEENNPNTNNLRNQLSNSSSKVITYWGEKPKLKGSVVDPNGKAYDIRYKMGNSSAETYAKPYQQMYKAMVTPGSHTIEFNGMQVKFNVATTQVINPQTGMPSIANKVLPESIQVSNPSNNPYNNQIIQNLSQSPAPELELLEATRNYRDKNYFDNNIFYRTQSTKRNNQ